MLAKGSKIILKEKMGLFDNIGEICEVIDVDGSGIISFRFGEGMHLGCMSADEFEKYFEEYVEPEVEVENTVTEEMIEDIMNHSKVIVNTVFGKCTIVSCQLPNGFVITESSACVDPENYDEEMGVEICLDKIINKVWELEGYRLQQMLYEDGYEFSCCEDECVDCECDCELRCECPNCEDIGDWIAD